MRQVFIIITHIYMDKGLYCRWWPFGRLYFAHTVPVEAEQARLAEEKRQADEERKRKEAEGMFCNLPPALQTRNVVLCRRRAQTFVGRAKTPRGISTEGR